MLGYFFRTVFCVGNEDKHYLYHDISWSRDEGRWVAHQLSDGKLTMGSLETPSEISMLEGCQDSRVLSTWSCKKYQMFAE